MTEPATPAPAPKKSLASRLAAAVAWARSPQGRTDLGALVAAVVATYTALHRAGV